MIICYQHNSLTINHSCEPLVIQGKKKLLPRFMLMAFVQFRKLFMGFFLVYVGLYYLIVQPLNCEGILKNKKMRFGLAENQFANLNNQALSQKARNFDTLDYKKMNKLFKFISIVDSSRQWTVMRAVELFKWIECGKHNRMLY